MNHIEKKIISPQIVIYKKAINFSDKVIDLINKNLDNSVFGKWEQWYDQGLRMSSILNKTLPQITEDYIMLENIANVFEYIISDYINDFGSEKYIWPKFIKDCSLIQKNKDYYEIDFFKYDYKKLKNKYIDDEELLLEYHVDEFDFNVIEYKRKNIITINMYLNDNYEGGEVCMYNDINKKIYKYKPKAGDVLIMPSGIPFYHAVKRFYKEDRYFCRTFVSYLEKVNDYNLNKIMLTEKDAIKKDLQIIKINGEEIEID